MKSSKEKKDRKRKVGKEERNEGKKRKLFYFTTYVSTQSSGLNKWERSQWTSPHK